MSEEKQPDKTDVEAYQAAINEVNEKFGYRIEARIVPVPNSNFVQAEIIAVKTNG